MLLQPYIWVLLFAVAAVVLGDSEQVEKTQNHDEDRKEEIESAQERSTSRSNGRTSEYSPEEKETYNLSVEEGEDAAADAANSYTSVAEPGQQRAMVYKSVDGRSKTYPKSYRQSAGSNYKPYKHSKLVEKQRSPPVESLPGVHPAVMRNLMKQEPQTFTDSEPSQAQEANQESNWQVSTNTGNNFDSRKVGFSLQRNGGRQGSFSVNKTPIYVPNRVSVQNPSSDSSFNVGYSIGFGNGQAQPPSSDFVKPSSRFRQGKAINVPISYQSSPVSMHFEGQDSFWKNMGSGVEMSQSVDTNPGTYQSYRSEPINDQSSQSPVTPEPSYGNDDPSQGFDDYPPPERFSFDHNHALQQSNAFDFSNAIDPSTNKLYSSDKLIQMTKESQQSFGDYFSKPLYPSFVDTMHVSNYESSPRQSKPTHVELSKGTTSHSGSSHHSHSGDRKGKFTVYQPDVFRYERPSYSDSPNSVVYHQKPLSVDFSKSFTKSAPPPSRAISSMNTHQISATSYDGSLGYPGVPVTSNMFIPTGKISPAGMIEAILVPVAPGATPFSVPMPIMEGGYSPYLGHPVGMIRVPVGSESSLHGGRESHNMEGPSYSGSRPEEYSSMESAPARQVHSHYTLVKHIAEQPSEPSQYHIQKVTYPVRVKGNHHTMKHHSEQPSEPSQYHIQKVTYPVRIQGNHHTIKHHSEQPSEPSQYHIQKVTYPTNPHTVKLKKILTTEAPIYMTSPTSSFTQPISAKTHLPRLQQGQSMIIVKRA